jgi:MFS family permease
VTGIGGGRFWDRLLGPDARILSDPSLQLILLANLMPPLGTAMLSPVLGVLIDPLGADATNIGLMLSAFTGSSILFIPLSGLAADRVGRKPVIVFGLVWFGLTGTALAFVETFEWALVLRFAQGIGFASLTPVLITSIGDLYGGRQEAAAQGYRFMTSGLTQTAFPLLAGILVGVSWRYPFLIYALALPTALIVQRHFVEPMQTGTSAAQSPDGSPAHLGALLRSAGPIALAVARASVMLPWFGFLAYNSIVVLDLLDGSPALAGILTALASLSYAFSASQVGRLAGRYPTEVPPLIGANVALILGSIAFFAASAVPFAVVGAILLGGGFGVALTMYRSVITSLAPPQLRGGFVSIAESGGRAAATATPVAVGALVAIGAPQLGFGAAVQAAGAVIGAAGGVIGIAAVLLVTRIELDRY